MTDFIPTTKDNAVPESEQCPENHGHPDPHHEHITDGGECWCNPRVITVKPGQVIPVEAVDAAARDELADLIARRRYAKDARPSVWITGRAAREVADVILAAGYRKASK